MRTSDGRTNQPARKSAMRQETEEQKINRLEKELGLLYDERDDLDEKIAALEEELAPYATPFEPGDVATTKTGQRVKVVEVQEAFGSYVVKAVAVDNKDKVKDGRKLVFDADDLTLVEK